MTKLEIVPAAFVDKAWREGAACLAEACNTSGGEITGDQLKLVLSRGERWLVRMTEEGETVGWGTVRTDQFPNVRVLHIADLVCHNRHFERFFDELKQMATIAGCSEVRWSCKDAQARLYRMKVKDEIEAVYTTYRVKL